MEASQNFKLQGETTPTTVQTCWKEIGVWGDNSCPQLKMVSHCRNCAVFSSTASQLLDIDVPSDYLERWTQHYSTPKAQADPTAIGVIIFRLGTEWFGLRTHTLQEITEVRPIHSLPHGPDAVMGLINIRGLLLIAVALANVLGLEPVTFAAAKWKRENGTAAKEISSERIMVVLHNCKPLAIPVHEIGGIQRLGADQFQPPPVTVTNAATAFTSKIFHWEEKVVGLLDEELLFYTIHKKLS